MKNALIDFTFNYEEKRRMTNFALSIEYSPYKEYNKFRQSVFDYSRSDEISSRFTSFIDDIKERGELLNPCVTMANCPIDDELPYPSYKNPVIGKREQKKTFVSEFFLMLYAVLSDQYPIGYANVNDGDVFQDILPWEKMKDTQSQKALG